MRIVNPQTLVDGQLISEETSELEEYFSKYRKNIIGIDHLISTPYHDAVKINYADWTASGRLYQPIENRFLERIFPLVANTHTDTNDTGKAMTYAYHRAQRIIKKHVGACDDDILISSDSGMTGVVNKLQRILGLRIHESFHSKIQLKKEDRPIVLITHMEHHSNQTSWLETIADVEIVEPDEFGSVSINNFDKAFKKHHSRKIKISAITSCSNVTGVVTPFMQIAELTHQYKGFCFVDFACSAPYVDIDMHVDDQSGKYLDAVYFSPHKFLGGPGTTGILVFNNKLYNNSIPDAPGGGTVDWTNPWGEHKYLDQVEAREDGGTPSFLQTMKVAMCLQLKNEMGVINIRKRKEEILKIIWSELDEIPNLHVLAKQNRDRLGVISFYIDGLHHNVGVKMLNDRFGIQTRGGCSCAGTYGHYLLNICREYSNLITDQISKGDISNKPGWIRMSIHPTHSNQDIQHILNGIKELAENFNKWIEDYKIEPIVGTIQSKQNDTTLKMHKKVDSYFSDRFN